MLGKEWDMILFETQRLSFRELQTEDINDLSALLSDEIVMAHCGGGMDRKGAQRWIVLAKEAYQKFGYDYWAVADRLSGGFIGQMGIMNQQIEGQNMDCLTYMVARNHWGKGYATEGAAACVHYGFHTLGIDRIYATVEPNNLASIRILEKTGMALDREILYFGERAYLYSIIKPDNY